MHAQTIPPPPSDWEANAYYYGLPSRPQLIARTGSPWVEPTGPEAYNRFRELRIVGDHDISDVWEDNLALKVHAILDEKGVDWSSTDIVRIGYVDTPTERGQVVLWIGVKPDSLSYEVAIDTAVQCKKLLLNHNISDVEVEIRQSELIQLAGPPLFQSVDEFFDPTAEVREPFTAALGIPICAQSTPYIEGTGGFFLDKGDDSNKLLLVTTRHVVFPQSDNSLYEHKSESQPRHNVLLFSDASFQQYLDSINERNEGLDISIDYHQRRIASMAGREDNWAITERKDAQHELEKAQEKRKALPNFHQELSTHWATDDSRILGHVVFSPPIAVGADTEQYTQDIAVIEIDPSKIDPSRFTGNVIDLGTEVCIGKLTAMMHPNAKNSHNFDFPWNRLLGLRGTITIDEMHKPTMYDKYGEPCIIVLKRGKTTGLTVGRGNNVFSYTRQYFSDNDVRVSKAWAVIPFDKESRAFSEKGDSGSVVVDGAGRIGGIITSGGGSTDRGNDMTYVTPIEFVLKTIRSHESFTKAYPKSGPAPPPDDGNLFREFTPRHTLIPPYSTRNRG